MTFTKPSEPARRRRRTAFTRMLGTPESHTATHTHADQEQTPTHVPGGPNRWSVADWSQRGRRRSGADSISRTTRALWLSGAEVGRGVRVTGPVLIRGGGIIVLRDGVVLDARLAPIELHARAGGRLEIGEGATIGPGVSIEVGGLVEIGPESVVEPFVKVMDNNWHIAAGDRHAIPPSIPVHIGARARLGARSIVLPGGNLPDSGILGKDEVLTRSGPLAGGLQAVATDGGTAAHGDRHLQTARLYWGCADEPRAAGVGTMLALAAFARLQRTQQNHPGQKLVHRAELAVALLRGHRAFRTAKKQGGVFAFGPLEVNNEAGRIVVGSGALFGGGPHHSRFDVAPGAQMHIGRGSGFNYGCLVRASERVTVGNDCLIGSRALILDRSEGRSGPVTIEDDVWLAHGVTLLPGVTVGSGSVVSAGSVIDRDVPPATLALGAGRFVPLNDRKSM